MTAHLDDLQSRMAEVLRAIVANPDLHWRWLNTLSLLEHVGSRKIFRANLGAEMNEMLLRHAAEEARHALFFKTMARREAGASPAFDPGTLLCGASANRYIQSLDGTVKDHLEPGRHYHCYLLTTYLIEVRAGEVYPLYQEILEGTGTGISLRSIILEEEGHLAEMRAEMETHSLLEAAHQLAPAEETFFARFLVRLENALQDRAMAHA
jgi:hypothetical protein